MTSVLRTRSARLPTANKSHRSRSQSVEASCAQLVILSQNGVWCGQMNASDNVLIHNVRSTIKAIRHNKYVWPVIQSCNWCVKECARLSYTSANPSLLWSEIRTSCRRFSPSSTGNNQGRKNLMLVYFFQ